MDKLNKLLNYIIPAEDKLKHFYIGSVIFFISLCLTSVFWGVIVLFTFGAGKEVYDYVSKKGSFEELDFILTDLPSIFYMIINSIK